MFKNRSFLIILIVVGMNFNIYATDQSSPEPPFRTLFSNDLTNIVTCDSPYSPKGTQFNKDGLYGSIDETAGTGIDVHMLQPGMGWTPFWKSSIYPHKKHAKWYKQTYGASVSSASKYMLRGGDIVGDFVKRCREKDLVPFISLRMNDRHQMNYVDITEEERKKYGIRVPNSLTASKIYMDHPEYRLEDYYSIPDREDMDLDEYIDKYRNEIRTNHLWNWAIPGAREIKLSFIREICENYDIDGFELDFMRHQWYFKRDVPVRKRKEIMTAFVEKVRDVLDKTAKNGEHRWLTVRIPFRLSDHGKIGVDVRQWYDAGVDIFNLSCSYVMEQQNDLAKIHKIIPEAPLYLELSHTPLRYNPADNSSTWDGASLRDRRMLTRHEQFYTAAHLAYSRGAAGISAFNFVYYRQHKESKGSNTYASPPFEVFEVLRDPDRVAMQPQHYYISNYDYNGKRFRQDTGPNFKEIFAIDMAPPKGGWSTDGKLRIQVDPAWGNAKCIVYFNGIRLRENEDISEPYPTKFEHGLGNEESLRAWTLPKSILKDGINRVGIAFTKDLIGSTRMIFLDIGIK